MLSINYMWREGSMTVLIETTPKMDLALHDIEHLVEELRAYHAIYSPLFQRREQREAAHTYLQGLLAPLFTPLKQRAVDGVIGAQLLHQVLNIVERQVHLGSGFDQYGHAALLPHVVDGQHYTTFQILVVVLGLRPDLIGRPIAHWRELLNAE